MAPHIRIGPRWLADYILQPEMRLTITDGGCWDLGWWDRLPSGQHYFCGISCWYAGLH